MNIKQEILKDFKKLKEYIRPVSIGQYDKKGVNIGYKSSEETFRDFLSQAIDRVEEETIKVMIIKLSEIKGVGVKTIEKLLKSLSPNK